jgi:hypothetical protein
VSPMNLPDLFDTLGELPAHLPKVDALGGFAAALHVSGEALQPAEVTRLFGIEPSESETRGVPVRHADGTVARTPSAGRWTLGVPASLADAFNFNEVVEAVLAKLPKDAAIWRSVGALGTLHVSVSLALDDSNGEMWLEPQLLSFLGERGVGVHVEIYRRDPLPPGAEQYY